MKPTNQTPHYRSLEDIVANINNECRWCSGKDCSVCFDICQKTIKIGA